MPQIDKTGGSDVSSREIDRAFCWAQLGFVSHIAMRWPAWFVRVVA